MPNNLTNKELEKAIEKAVNLPHIDFCGVICKFTEDIINRAKANEKHYRRKAQNQKKELKRLNEVVNRKETEIKRLDIESDILRADVENLNRICDEVNAENESLKAEIERLKGIIKNAQAGIEEILKITGT